MVSNGWIEEFGGLISDGLVKAAQTEWGQLVRQAEQTLGTLGAGFSEALEQEGKPLTVDAPAASPPDGPAMMDQAARQTGAPYAPFAGLAIDALAAVQAAVEQAQQYVSGVGAATPEETESQAVANNQNRTRDDTGRNA